MPGRRPLLGIGVITYNRCALLAETIARVRALTRHPDTMFVVADDGSSDGTVEMLRTHGLPVISGVNMGVMWNKNRAMFLLHQVFGCETVLLLEDDATPVAEGWEADWLRATQRWHHVNFAAPWQRWGVVAGSGTPDDPILSYALTAQCCGFTRQALTYGGYFDIRFQGFGIGHVEHTHRLHRLGFGGRTVQYGGQDIILSESIHGSIEPRDAVSHYNADNIERNRALYLEVFREEGFRAPWRDDTGMNRLRAEVSVALQAGEDRFVLRPAG